MTNSRWERSRSNKRGLGSNKNPSKIEFLNSQCAWMQLKFYPYMASVVNRDRLTNDEKKLLVSDKFLMKKKSHTSEIPSKIMLFVVTWSHFCNKLINGYCYWWIG